MPMGEPAPISPQRACGQTERVAREWAVTFAELFCVSLAERGPRFVDLWVSALTDLPPDVLDAACRRAMKSCKFFPTPAEIRAGIDRAEAGASEIEAQHAWQRVLEFSERGVWSKVKMLTTRERHALRVVGGSDAIAHCDKYEDLKWRQRDFVAAFLRFEQVEVSLGLLSDGHADRVTRQLYPPRREPPKQLAAPPPEPARDCKEDDAAPASDEDRANFLRGFEELKARVGINPPAPTPNPPQRRRIAVVFPAPHSENDPRTPEGKLWREWARLHSAGETDLLWPEYKKQVLGVEQ
jgi:hypothetical protein